MISDVTRELKPQKLSSVLTFKMTLDLKCWDQPVRWLLSEWDGKTNKKKMEEILINQYKS